MQKGSSNWSWIVTAFAIVSASAYPDVSAAAASAAQESLERTRLQLQQQAFKTDLSNFNFSTSAELRAREAILNSAAPKRNVAPFQDHPDLMEATGSNNVIVVWEQNSLRRQTASWPNESYELTWDDFAEAINQSQQQVDAACAAILSGPIQFDLDASAGNHMLLRHLPLLKSLTQILNDRVMLALHAGDREAAWTNLMAANRLVTAWNPEPVEVSHRVRAKNATLVFEATWQALQTNRWTDNQLARLQHEWETADFLSGLQEIQAFRRAGDFQALERDTPASQTSPDVMYEEQERLLRFYRDREIEYRNAVLTGTWMQMRQMPGITNEVSFEPKNRYGRFGMSLRQRSITMQIVGEGISIFTQVAEAEAQRRVIITAVALERHRARHKRYPETLQALAPEFMNSVPTDFVTGRPLHYRLAEDGRFLLYSVGLDCVDNGGKVQARPTGEERYRRLTNPDKTVPESDVVWPLAARPAQVVAFRQHQAQAQAQRDAQRKAEIEVEEKADKEQAEQARHAAMKKLLARKPSLGKEPVHEGVPLSSWVIKVGQIEEYGAPKDAVAAIRAIGSNAVPFLLEWMPQPGADEHVEGFPSWTDVDIAWWALGSAGKSAIPTLARNINRPRKSMDDYSVWTRSAKAISYLGPDAIVPMLTAATNMAGKHELWELLQHFENLGTNGEPAIPALIRWANDPDEMIRKAVVSALGGIAKRPDLALPVILNALEHDPNWIVRRDAAEALGSFANDSEAVLPSLIKALKHPDWHARGGALSGLGKIRNKPEIVVPLIAPFLYDENNVIQRTAAYALRDLGSEAGYRALLQASNAPSSWPGIGDIIYQVEEKARRDKSQ